MSAATPVGDLQHVAVEPANGDETPPKRTAARHTVPGWWAIPGVAAVLALIYVPTVMGSFYAFTDWKGIGGWHWIGLQNFRDVLDDKELLGSLKNTVVLAFAFVVLTNLLGLLLALALNR